MSDITLTSSSEESQVIPERLPKWTPHKAYTIYYHVEPDEKLNPEYVLEKRFKKYGGSCSNDQRRLDFSVGSTSNYFRILEKKDYDIFFIASGVSNGEASHMDPTLCEEVKQLFEEILETVPKEADLICQMRIAYAANQDSAKVLLREDLRTHEEVAICMGAVDNSLLARVEGINTSTFRPSKSFIIIPYRGDLEANAESVWKLCLEVALMELNDVGLNRLYSGRKLMFEQIDASEESTQLGINETLSKMRRPVDEMQPDDLESILKDTTIQFSRLSTTSSTMRRDYVKARSLYQETNSLLRGWNEKPVGELRTNSSTQIDHMRNIIIQFRDFIQRTEALTAQFNTILDSVRTYLSIKQQKMNIAEQTSSREQLIRLVNLQEILHKLETLVIAFYLTEMARIMFDALYHELAGVMTVAFIPVALLASVIAIKVLHRR